MKYMLFKLGTNLKIIARFYLIALFTVSVSSCKSTSDNKKEQAQLRLEMAQGLLRGQNYPTALKELLQALNDDPNNPGIHSALGEVYFARERYELSEKHYLKALSLKSDFTAAKNNLARSYIETGRLSKAEALLSDAIKDLTYVNYNLTYLNFGLLEFKKNNFEKSIDYFKKSLEKDRENCTSHVYMGRAFMELNQYETAVAQLDKSISFCSAIDSDAAHYYSAIAHYRNKNFEKSQLRFEELMTLFPNGPHYEKAEAMLKLIKKGTP